MKNLQCFFVLSLMLISFSCEKENGPTIGDLCSMDLSEENSNVECQGSFLFHADDLSGTVNYSSEIGDYIILSSDIVTYDCSIIGVVCDRMLFEDIIGSEVVFSANVHKYNGIYQSTIGGQQLVGLSEFSILSGE